MNRSNVGAVGWSWNVVRVALHSSKDTPLKCWVWGAEVYVDGVEAVYHSNLFIRQSCFDIGIQTCVQFLFHKMRRHFHFPDGPVIAVISNKDWHFQSCCCHNFNTGHWTCLHSDQHFFCWFSFLTPSITLTLHKVTAAALYLSMPEAV